jgi:hypothetical protein
MAFKTVKGLCLPSQSICINRLKKIFEFTSFPSLVKTETMLRHSGEKRNEAPESWINYLEELRMKLEDIRATIRDNQFPIHVFSIIAIEYERACWRKELEIKRIRLKLMKCATK